MKYQESVVGIVAHMCTFTMEFRNSSEYRFWQQLPRSFFLNVILGHDDALLVLPRKPFIIERRSQFTVEFAINGFLNELKVFGVTEQRITAGCIAVE